MDKLTVEEAEKIAATRCDDASRIARQLVGVLRENERLRAERNGLIAALHHLQVSAGSFAEGPTDPEFSQFLALEGLARQALQDRNKHSLPVYEDQHIVQYDATDQSLLIKDEEPKHSDDGICHCDNSAYTSRYVHPGLKLKCKECGGAIQSKKLGSYPDPQDRWEGWPESPVARTKTSGVCQHGRSLEITCQECLQDAAIQRKGPEK